MTIGIVIFEKDRDRDRDLNFGDLANGVHSIFNPPESFFFTSFIENLNFEILSMTICLFEHMYIVTIQL